MDSLQFDYTSYSDASTPRTPSPRTSICSDDAHPYSSPHNFKPAIDMHLARNIFADPLDDSVAPESHTLEAAHMWSIPYPGSLPPPSSRGSLLEELYDNDMHDHQVAHDVYHDHHPPAELSPHGGHWNTLPDMHPRHQHDIGMARRATFPYVRHDRAEALPYSSQPFMSSDDSMHSSPYSSRPNTVYGEPLPMDGSMDAMEAHRYDAPFAHTVPMTSSPHHYHEYDHQLDGIKTEESPLIVPSQSNYGRPSSAGMHPLPCIQQHPGMLVQHTDDAASKETQYLRRRCNNCHTTEPPSWRRSTLNPGKIVCNKCGLYERTHLRPRPLRFDELRAGSKTRKQPKLGGSPKAGKMTQMVKKEPRDEGMMPRRSSVSSSSSVHSGSGASDWDENVSAYSGSSAPPSSFNSPAVSTFSMPRDPNSQSPPRDGGIRLPNAPLSDIASLQSQLPQHSSPPTPRKSASVPSPYYSPQLQGQDYYATSVPADMHGPGLDMTVPEATGWQSVPLSDLAPSKPLVKSRSNSLRKAVAV